jgi:hypothetical protein
MPELLNTHDEEEPDPLIEAAWHDDLSRLAELIADGVAVDPVDQSTSALAHAASGGHLDAVKLLLDAGANVNHSPDGLSPLAAACRDGHLEIAQFLFSKGARIDAHPATILGWALSREGGTKEVLAFLVKNGLPPNTLAAGGTTALMAVCRHGDLDSAKLLLERGADLNARHRGSALSVAEENGHRVLVDFLLERGAKPETPTIAPDPERDALHAEATEQPLDAQRRLAWAKTLLRYGCRAALARELQHVRALGLEPDVATPFIENPPGVRWTFLPFDDETSRVSPLVDDARFPKALLQHADQTLPLAVLLGKPCTRCDERGQVTCSDCNGTGTAENYLTGRSYECERRSDCYTCMGLKYEVRSQRFGRGACSHPTLELEFTRGKRTLSRCTTCGLATFEYGEFACGVCGHFVCGCTTSSR